jgi:drug/metabolite transporter (DMT)-like permease
MEDTELIKSSATDDDDGAKPRRGGAADPTPLWVTMAIYVATALMQPTLTDEIRYSGGAGHVGWPPTVLATASNTVAMASLLAIAPGGWAALRQTLRSKSSATVLMCTAIDFASGCLLTTGLLMVGGGTFVVVYASTSVWTAIWARCTGQRLSFGRWAGVGMVFAGMVLHSSQGLMHAAAEGMAASTSLVLGLCAVVVGTMLHAAMFVVSELAIKQSQIDLLQLCAGMGLIETTVLLLWNGLLLTALGPSLYLPDAPPAREGAGLQRVLLLYLLLTLVNAVHAWSFFHMLSRVGAVTSAVMKGTQVILVFAFSVLYFCRLQATQCFSWSKAAGVGVVALGLLVYARSTSTGKKPTLS